MPISESDQEQVQHHLQAIGHTCSTCGYDEEWLVADLVGATPVTEGEWGFMDQRRVGMVQVVCPECSRIFFFAGASLGITP